MTKTKKGSMKLYCPICSAEVGYTKKVYPTKKSCMCGYTGIASIKPFFKKRYKIHRGGVDGVVNRVLCERNEPRQSTTDNDIVTCKKCLEKVI